jgi:hypothetical protein
MFADRSRLNAGTGVICLFARGMSRRCTAFIATMDRIGPYREWPDCVRDCLLI